ncbi:IclR family transcriptional regulator C-terminal domain-containing protein [Methylocella sp. CPCC 101449]|jgi:DNA-binding IclR family transcriptional regulator|uniref:IclR family transcriptional regulator n=1 Tax=Methylocella sp. CPCC 101449 TaxID=2987531 RepID=UPI00288DD71B|nr:IclR family transcriptional regulator C-terminal domain-containing protein [Methylocella sp. CPCC 101449]MDT2021033.1 helix-turn-helix domain-containing protein [Methylocella sp. CPCC 101449]HEV2570710.1 IclR family transcriptional regulator C-terminal domain-containing protein [Beijerinckiaceae bacterium]
MAGFSRFLGVLRLFTPDTPAWTVPALAETTGVPASTVYRTVRDLVASGFLEQAAEASYRLGPAFIEFDRSLRLTDPLVVAGRPVLHDVVMQAHVPCVAMLARFYNGSVMCVADEAAADTPFRSSYERGRPMPLVRGSTSKVILAHLPTRQFNKLIENAGLDNKAEAKVEALRTELADIRKRGFCSTASEIDPGLAGISAPVILKDAGIVASLSIVAHDAGIDEGQRRRLILLVVSAASLLAEDLRHRYEAATKATQKVA